MPNAFMQEAIKRAVENVRSGRGGPFAAVVVKGGRIIAAGANCVTSNNDPTAHAEVIAIREACRVLGTFQLTGCEIYTTCEPCPMCLGAIYWSRAARVFYGCTQEDAARIGSDDSVVYQQMVLPPMQRKIQFNTLLRDEALKAFTAWEQNP